MKKIKIILLVLLVLILTGCKGEYNLEINKDLSLKEEINFSIDNTGDTYDKTIELFENNNIDDSLYRVTQNDEYVNVHYEEEFTSFEDYILNSKFYSMFFGNEDFKKDNKSIYYKGLANLKLDDNSNSSNLNNSYYISNMNINLTIPFVIKDHNADSVNGNTLTWILDEENTFKNIKFSFDYLKKNNLYIIIIVLCLGVIIGTIGLFTRNYLKERGI